MQYRHSKKDGANRLLLVWKLSVACFCFVSSSLSATLSFSFDPSLLNNTSRQLQYPHRAGLKIWLYMENLNVDCQRELKMAMLFLWENSKHCKTDILGGITQRMSSYLVHYPTEVLKPEYNTSAMHRMKYTNGKVLAI